MRVAFHAPLKPPDHPTPSGERTMARLLMAALEMASCEVELASRLRTLDALGDVDRQRRIAHLGARLGGRLVARYRRRPAGERPQMWFTYHLYHKAPDWLGLTVSRALRIPYVVAEASHAEKQRRGPWADGLAAAAEAIAAADLIITLNSADAEGLRPLVADTLRLALLEPFIDARPFADAARRAECHRAALAARCGIDGAEPLLLTVAMMRSGAKLGSYRVLAQALRRIADRRWRLIVVGDGPAAEDVHAALAPLGARVSRLGRVDRTALPAICAACDLHVWPAIGEAYGLALLEAEAAGLPVVAGSTGGVPDVVRDGESGLLVPVGDAGRFADAVASLLDDPERRRRMGARAAERVRRDHDLPVAARRLGDLLARLAE